MQQRQIDNLKVLISESPLLSSIERSEWLQLMAVMNDKQLLELEHILTSYKKPLAVEPLRPMQRSTPISLSHIVNLPKSGQGQAPAFSPVSAAVPATVTKSAASVLKVPTPAPKKTNIFAAKMKRMLNEKELPEGPTEKQLAEHASMVKPVMPSQGLKIFQMPKLEPKKADTLSVHLPQKPIVPPVPAKPQMREEIKTVKPQVNIPEPLHAGLQNFPQGQLHLNNLPEGATIHIHNSTVSIQPVKVSPKKVLGDMDIPVIQSSSPADIRSNIAGIKVRAEEEKNFRAGLKNTDVLLSAKFQKDQEEQRRQEVLRQKAEEAKPSLPDLEPLVPLSVTIESLDDASKLSVRLWQNESHASLQKALIVLIQRFGYHETIFSLERSPLYEAYIHTGLKILKDSSTFETLAATKTEMDVVYLSRDDFEGFTDLLRKIQAAT